MKQQMKEGRLCRIGIRFRQGSGLSVCALLLLVLLVGGFYVWKYRKKLGFEDKGKILALNSLTDKKIT